MKIHVKGGLPYISATLFHRGQQITLRNVLLDTGSAGTIFSTDKINEIGLTYEPDDLVHRIRGVGGSEFVFSKKVDRLSIGDLGVDFFEIEVGAMNYGFEIEGIIGLDFLMRVGAVLDLSTMEIHSGQ